MSLCLRWKGEWCFSIKYHDGDYIEEFKTEYGIATVVQYNYNEEYTHPRMHYGYPTTNDGPTHQVSHLDGDTHQASHLDAIPTRSLTKTAIPTRSLTKTATPTRSTATPIRPCHPRSPPPQAY